MNRTVEAAIRIGVIAGLIAWCFMIARPFLVPVIWGAIIAVAVFHGENANGSCDQGFLGLPLEDYGFSNGAPAFLGPPSFGQAKFAVPEKGIRITIDVD